jgi:hypothetical protein
VQQSNINTKAESTSKPAGFGSSKEIEVEDTGILIGQELTKGYITMLKMPVLTKVLMTMRSNYDLILPMHYLIENRLRNMTYLKIALE